MQVDRAKALQHEVIVHCKANPDKKVIEAIDVVFKNYRVGKGTRTKKRRVEKSLSRIDVLTG